MCSMSVSCHSVCPSHMVAKLSLYSLLNTVSLYVFFSLKFGNCKECSCFKSICSDVPFATLDSHFTPIVLRISPPSVDGWSLGPFCYGVPASCCKEMMLFLLPFCRLCFLSFKRWGTGTGRSTKPTQMGHNTPSTTESPPELDMFVHDCHTYMHTYM